jgi:hypothetical protein
MFKSLMAIGRIAWNGQPIHLTIIKIAFRKPASGVQIIFAG